MANSQTIFDLHEPQWCPGCGNFSLLTALKQALVELGIKPHELIVAAGIGQASKIGFSLKANLFDGLHGRTLPLAMGIRLANHRAPLLAISGDGCFFAEGGNHFIHNLRRDLDVVIIAGNNRVFGLTKGQAAPTAEADFSSKLQPGGSGAEPLNPCALALVSGASFVARSFTGNQAELAGLIEAAFRHRGAAFIDVLSPCVSFNKINTFSWYKENTAPLPGDYVATDRDQALQRARRGDSQGRLLTGLFYQNANNVHADAPSPTLVERSQQRRPADIEPLLAAFR